MCSNSRSAHILIYPFPAPGHIIPLLDLTHHLLARGLTITALITPTNLSLFPPPSTNLHHFLLPSPQLVSSSNNFLLSYVRALRDTHFPVILDCFQSHPSPPIAIISDFFLGWTHHLAFKLGVPRIVFSPSGAFAFSVTVSLWRNLPCHDDESLVSFPDVPNCPTYPCWQISHAYRTSKEGDPNWEFFRDCFLINSDSWGIIFNSFDELEQVYLDHVRSKFGNDRVWAVGPVLPHGDNRGGPCHDVLRWLDARRENSVVYISFGSREVLTCKQLDELTAALEKSSVHFIWSFRQPNEQDASNDDGVLPKGYEDRIAERGLIIKGWAPQLAILQHHAVGVFLTHCGWNSVLEGIATGVMMLTWPMGADQFINTQLVVDQLGVGIRVGEDTQKIPNSTELAQTLDMSIMENLPERVNAKRIQKAAMGAIKGGGSSNKDIDALIKSLH